MCVSTMKKKKKRVYIEILFGYQQNQMAMLQQYLHLYSLWTTMEHRQVCVCVCKFLFWQGVGWHIHVFFSMLGTTGYTQSGSGCTGTARPTHQVFNPESSLYFSPSLTHLFTSKIGHLVAQYRVKHRAIYTSHIHTHTQRERERGHTLHLKQR